MKKLTYIQFLKKHRKHRWTTLFAFCGVFGTIWTINNFFFVEQYGGKTPWEDGGHVGLLIGLFLITGFTVAMFLQTYLLWRKNHG